MINKDYILRIAERFGRALAIILHLREFNHLEEALLYIDDLFLQSIGLTSSFLNSVSEDVLLQMLSPLGALDIDKCLWIAVLLKAEGDIYEDKGTPKESYYRYLKALHLFLEALLREPALRYSDFYTNIDELCKKLEEYELPEKTRRKVFVYYEQIGRYAQAEDILFELLDSNPTHAILEEGLSFYTRLRAKNTADLLAGNLSREEVVEGMARLQQLKTSLGETHTCHQ